jgi:hypothetical protein
MTGREVITLKIDVCTLMYLTFQRTRHADPLALVMLRTLASVLEVVEQQRTFALDLADLDLAISPAPGARSSW